MDVEEMEDSYLHLMEFICIILIGERMREAIIILSFMSVRPTLHMEYTTLTTIGRISVQIDVG